MADEREFTEAQLRWAFWMGRNTSTMHADALVSVARVGLGLLWAGEGDREDG